MQRIEPDERRPGRRTAAHDVLQVREVADAPVVPRTQRVELHRHAPQSPAFPQRARLEAACRARRSARTLALAVPSMADVQRVVAVRQVVGHPAGGGASASARRSRRVRPRRVRRRGAARTLAAALEVDAPVELRVQRVGRHRDRHREAARVHDRDRRQHRAPAHAPRGRAAPARMAAASSTGQPIAASSAVLVARLMTIGRRDSCRRRRRCRAGARAGRAMHRAWCWSGRVDSTLPSGTVAAMTQLRASIRAAPCCDVRCARACRRARRAGPPRDCQAGVEDDAPLDAVRWRDGQLERHLVRIEDDEQVAGSRVARRRTVHQHGDRAQVGVVPVRIHHFAARRVQPRDVLGVDAAPRAFQERVAPQPEPRLAQVDQLPDELDQRLDGVRRSSSRSS